jgi:HNH endonuclease/NUMOD4 motif
MGVSNLKKGPFRFDKYDTLLKMEKMMEKWRIIREVPNYQVSDEGRIKNFKTGKILKPYSDGRGRLKISLLKDKKIITRYVHVLVAREFIRGEAPGLEVKHIDKDRTNNRAENLQWGKRQLLRQWMVSDDRKSMRRIV